MSTHLYWAPAAPVGDSLPYELKKVLARRLWSSDGSLAQSDVVVGEDLIPYLEGLHDAGIMGANVLINLIKRHRTVRLYIS